MINTSSKNNICAVIPFYNEEKNIEEIIRRTLPFVDLIILVDDGSADGSIRKINANESVILLTHNSNLGKGAALNTGFKESAARGCSLTVTLDSDLQHDPKFIPPLAEKIDSADIVIGNRMTDTFSMPFHRKMSNKLTSFFLSMKIGVEIPDSQCGFRVYRTEILKNILPKSKGFDAETEILIKAARKKYKINSVPISTIYNTSQSKMRGFRTTIGFIKQMLS